MYAGPVDPRISSRLGAVVSRLPTYRTASALRSSAGTARLLRSAVTAPASGATFTVRGRAGNLPWRSVSFTTSTTNASDLRDGVIAAWNADAGLAGIATASAAISGTAIDWTSLWVGDQDPFEVEITANPGSDLGAISVVQAGAYSFEAVFGSFYRVSGYVDQADVLRPVIAELAEVSGPVLTYTITNDASGAYSGTISVSDPTGAASVTFPFSFSGDASAATTDANAVAAFEALFTTATVTNPSTGSVVISWPVGYVAIPVTTVASGGSADLTVAVTDSGDTAPDLVLCLDDGSGGSGLQAIGTEPTGYDGDRAALVLHEGARVSVIRPSGAITAGSIVWVESASSGRGLPLTSPTPTSIPHPVLKWVVDDSNSTDRAIIGG